jgi:hypothetical protein
MLQGFELPATGDATGSGDPFPGGRSAAVGASGAGTVYYVKIKT